jgi:hypothetical protein
MPIKTIYIKSVSPPVVIELSHSWSAKGTDKHLPRIRVSSNCGRLSLSPTQWRAFSQWMTEQGQFLKFEANGK